MPAPSVEELWDAVNDGDAAFCERLVIELEGAPGVTPAALVKVADLFARAGDVEGVIRMEERARMRRPFRGIVWSGLRIKALALAHDLEGGVQQLQRMRRSGTTITAAAIVPLLRAAVRGQDTEVMLTCLETMAERNLELQPHISETVRRALMLIDADPSQRQRLQQLIDGWPAERGKLRLLADMARLDDGRIEDILAALAADDIRGALGELRGALADGLVPDRGITRQITRRLPVAEGAEIEHLILSTGIANGERPSAPFCVQVLGNYARLGDARGIDRVLDEMLDVGVQLGPKHLATALSGAVKAQDAALLGRVLELLLGEHGVPFEADHQYQVLMAAGHPELARTAAEVLAAHSGQTAIVQHTTALVSLVAREPMPADEAVAAVQKALDDRLSLSKPYWDALIAIAPQEAVQLIVRSLFQRLESGLSVSPAFCTQVLSVLAGSGDYEQIRKVLQLMDRHGLEINDVHLGAVIHRFSSAGDTTGLRAIVDTLIELRIPLPSELLDWILRGWDSDPQELYDHLCRHASELSLSSAVIETSRIEWLMDHDELDAAHEAAERHHAEPEPPQAPPGPEPASPNGADDEAERAAVVGALKAFIDDLPEHPDWYEAGERFDVLTRRARDGDGPAGVAMKLVESAVNAAEAWRYLEICERLGVAPDLRLYSVVLSRYVDEDDVRGAEEVLEEAVGAGLQPDARIYSDLVRLYAQAGDLEAARRLLDEAREAGF